MSIEENTVSKLDIVTQLVTRDHSTIKFKIDFEIDYKQPLIKKLFNRGSDGDIKSKTNSINGKDGLS